MRSVILIPARMESTRFPGKPLRPILGKPMIQWVFEAAEASEASDAFIVTDSQEIMQAVEAFGGAAILTSDLPVNGTERCIEAMDLIDPQGDTYDVIINVQGDEPLIRPRDIDRLLEMFEENEVDIATFIQPIREEAEYRDPNVVKAVPTLFEDDQCDICYFSRASIPHMDTFEPDLSFKHIGVYGFTATAFEEIRNIGPSPLEQSERLEQLRWLQNHLLISARLTESPFIGVDTEADLQAVEKVLTSKSR